MTDDRLVTLEIVRRALRIGHASFDGDDWYAKDAGLVEDGDEGEAVFAEAFAILAALPPCGHGTELERLRGAVQELADEMAAHGDPLAAEFASALRAALAAS